MTSHRHRYGQRIAKGYRAKNGGTVGLMVRFAPEDFDHLRALAVARGIPMAAIVRDLVERNRRAEIEQSEQAP